MTPLTLTILAEDTPPEKRGAILGAWGGIAGLAVAIGPIVGGALTTGIAWQWIFWLNVPIGLVTIPLAWIHLRETKGPADKLDIPGVVVAVVGLFCIVWGVVRSNTLGWGSPEVLGFIIAGIVIMGVVRLDRVALEGADAAAPLLPQPRVLGRERRVGRHVLRHVRLDLPADAVPPDRAGLLGARRRPADARVDGRDDARRAGRGHAVRPLSAAGRSWPTGLALQAVALGWLAAIMTPTVSYSHLVAPFIIAGVGMGLFFAPVANVVLSAVGWQEQGQASGANNAMRELGGVFGIAVLAAIFANQGGYFTAQTFMDGLKPAVWVGAVIVGIGAVMCLLIPRKQRRAGRAHAAQGDWSQGAQEGTGEWSGMPATPLSRATRRASRG